MAQGRFSGFQLGETRRSLNPFWRLMDEEVAKVEWWADVNRDERRQGMRGGKNKSMMNRRGIETMVHCDGSCVRVYLLLWSDWRRVLAYWFGVLRGTSPQMCRDKGLAPSQARSRWQMKAKLWCDQSCAHARFEKAFAFNFFLYIAMLMDRYNLLK